MNHGSASFTGLGKVAAASFSLGPGAQPSSGTIITPPHTATMPRGGELTLSYGSTVIRFPDCAVVNASIDRSGGPMLWNLTIIDRRWRWAYGGIKRSYNVPVDPDADPIVYRREASPRTIARWVLEEYLTEQNIDVDALPDDMRPMLDWDFVTPAAALDQLCLETGCRIILRTDNRVGFVKVGLGNPAPGGPITKSDFSVARGDFPSGLLGVSAPIQYDIPFTLEAVAEDLDGKYKPIDSEDLSYRPDNGWDLVAPPEFTEAWENMPTSTYGEVRRREKVKELCKKTVWRMYRAKEPLEAAATWLKERFEDHLTETKAVTTLPSAAALAVTDLARSPTTGDGAGAASAVKETKWKMANFLPFLPKLRSVYEYIQDDDEDTEDLPEEHMDPFVYGEYYDWRGKGLSTPDGNTQVDFPFSLDEQRGIVHFDEPVYKLESTGATTNKIVKPELTLVVSCYLMFDPGYSSYIIVPLMAYGGVEGDDVTPAQNHASYETVVIPEVEPAVLFRDNGEFGQDNGEASLNELRARLEVLSQRYVEEPGGTKQYSGLIDFVPDGIAQQVTWDVADVTLTTIGFFQEVDDTSLTYSEKVEATTTKAERRQAYLDRKATAKAEFQASRRQVPK